MTTVTAPTDIEALEQAVRAMRRLGVTKWGAIELGPDPVAPIEQPQTPSRDEQERREREERRHVALAASGGIVKRLPVGQ